MLVLLNPHCTAAMLALLRPPSLLQSPLFVAAALLSAAQQQLAQELQVARQDAASVRLVRSQLAAFRREMEKEGQIQVGGRWAGGRTAVQQQMSGLLPFRGWLGD